MITKTSSPGFLMAAASYAQRETGGNEFKAGLVSTKNILQYKYPYLLGFVESVYTKLGPKKTFLLA